MHALNGKHIPYALNDDNDELDENDSDDVFDDDYYREKFPMA